jgi:hypothetical protein
MLHVFNQVIREFARLRLIALSMGDPVIPNPEVSKITSFTSQLRKALRNGAAVDEATVQDIHNAPHDRNILMGIEQEPGIMVNAMNGLD